MSNRQVSNEINLRMLHSPYRVDVKDYDEGHGGPVPPDYIVRNNAEQVATFSCNGDAIRVCKDYNDMRLMLLEQLLKEAEDHQS